MLVNFLSFSLIFWIYMRVNNRFCSFVEKKKEKWNKIRVEFTQISFLLLFHFQKKSAQMSTVEKLNYSFPVEITSNFIPLNRYKLWSMHMDREERGKEESSQ